MKSSVEASLYGVLQLLIPEAKNDGAKKGDMNKHFSKEDIQIANIHMIRYSASLVIRKNVN